MKLKELADALHFYQTTDALDETLTIKGLKADSRNVKKGDLFFCIKGLTVDGHSYAQQAEARGAVCIVAEFPVDVSIPVLIVGDTSRALALLSNKYYDFPTQKLHLIGITGTNGKTSITYLLEAIFKEHKHRTGLIGTIQMKIEEEIFNVKNTTPDALFLQKSMARMVEKQLDTVLMEVSSHALDMGRVFGCDFDIAVFTNLTQDHLDYHKNMQEYFHAKSLLFAQLGNKYDPLKPKFAIFNLDDPHSERLMNSTAQPVLTYGIDRRAEVTAVNIQLGPAGSSFILHTPKGSTTISSKLTGKFSIYNMLAATAAALCAGVPLKTIKRALAKTTGIRGRFEPVHAGQSFGVIVDYAHTPDSLKNVLTTIQSFAKKKIYVVLGCGGDRDKTKRPLMAQVAVNYADEAIFTSDNPRTEDPKMIIQDMIRGLTQNNYQSIIDRRAAIEYAINQAAMDDIVLIAGKGHETYQQLKNKVIDFDDREVALEFIFKKLNKEN